MELVACDLGASTADAEQVEVRFSSGRLIVSFVDWQSRPREIVFEGLLAFRWQELDEPGVRDDTTYEVIDSPWLARQADLQAVRAEDHAHYMLCFNAAGVLDVLASRRT